METLEMASDGVAKGLRLNPGRVSLSTWMWLNECLFYICMLCYVLWVGLGSGLDEGSWCM